MIFGYTLTQCVSFFREHSSKPLNTKIFEDEDLATQANQIRLYFVDKIFCAAYVNDVSVNDQFQSLVEYFVNSYTSKEKLLYMKTNVPALKNPETFITSEVNFIQEISRLSSTEFDTFLKIFAQF